MVSNTQAGYTKIITLRRFSLSPFTARNIVAKKNLFVKRKKGIIEKKEEKQICSEMGTAMIIPKNAAFIIGTLEKHGYEAYVVGGCVRDMVLGREPEDWDITTSAQPMQVKTLFRRTIDTGIQHGTVTVMLGDEGYEVTTYRTDGEYEDHRHPKEVLYTPDLKEDLERRDFTINAMAYHPERGMVDLFDGSGDLKRRCIRCVGNPEKRFEEDALRMLRGIRFAAQLEFDVEEDTMRAIVGKAPTLVNVSAERIRTELTKLLVSDGCDRLLLLAETGLSRYFLPELDVMLATRQQNPHHCFDVGRHSIKVIQYVNEIYRENAADFSRKEHVMLVYAALLHDVAKPDCKSVDEEGIDHFYGHPERGETKARQILRRLKFDNDTVSVVSRLIRYHDRRHGNCLVDGAYSPKGKKGMRRLINEIGKSAMPLLFCLQEADLRAQSEYKQEEKLQKLAAAKRCYSEIIEAGDAVTIQELAVDGSDLIAMGVPSGPRIGGLLRKLLEYVLENPQYNTEYKLKEIARRWIEKDD